jgi:hypothetical protein
VTKFDKKFFKSFLYSPFSHSEKSAVYAEKQLHPPPRKKLEEAISARHFALEFFWICMRHFLFGRFWAVLFSSFFAIFLFHFIFALFFCSAPRGVPPRGARFFLHAGALFRIVWG